MEQLQSVLINLAIAVIPVLAAFIIAFLKKKTSELQDNIDNQKANKYIDIAHEAVEQVVGAIAQTYVDKLKESNSFDDDAKKSAFILAKTRVLTIVGLEGKKVLGQLYGDVDVYLNALIESEVKNIQ